MQNMIYTARRPFHPRRLFALLYDKFIIQQSFPEGEDEVDDDGEDEDDSGEEEDEDMSEGEEGQDEDEDEAMGGSPGSSGTLPGAGSTPRTSVSAPSDAGRNKGEENAKGQDDLVMPANEVILRNKRVHPVFGRLFRSKGEFWLASRPGAAGDWSSAGAMLTLRASRPWFCVLPPAAYETGDAEIDALVSHDIAQGGEWGDRRQELVFIGGKQAFLSVSLSLSLCVSPSLGSLSFPVYVCVPGKTGEAPGPLLHLDSPSFLGSTVSSLLGYASRIWLFRNPAQLTLRRAGRGARPRGAQPGAGRVPA